MSGETEKPDSQHHKCNFVKLMMIEFVALVHFKNKGVVDRVGLENLNAQTSSEHDVGYHRCAVVNRSAAAYLLYPIGALSFTEYHYVN
jgi:hypothetical protein